MIALAGIALAALAMASAVAFKLTCDESRKFRIDIQPHQSVFDGESVLWFLNLGDPDNYRDGTGRRFIGRIVLFSFGTVGGSTVALLILAHEFF